MTTATQAPISRLAQAGDCFVTHSEIYRGKTLTCTVLPRGRHLAWEYQIDREEKVVGPHVATGSMLPSAVLAEAMHAGRKAIDLDTEQVHDPGPGGTRR